MEYITTDPGRTTLKQILNDRDKKVAMCVAHSCSMQTECAKRANSLFPSEGAERGSVPRRLDFGTSITNENLLTSGDHNEQQPDQCADGDDGTGGESNAVCQQNKLDYNSRRTKLIRENQELVLHFCKNKAFDEGEATRLLCSTPEGIAVPLNRNFGERLTTALRIAKTLVFSESHEQRMQRSKQYELQQDPTAADPTTIEKGVE